MKVHRFYDTFNFLLLPFSYLYQLLFSIYKAVYRYRIIPQQKFKEKIVSVGNLTVGGTGKTPFVIFLAELFNRNNKKVSVVSRGYKRRRKDRLIDIMTNSNNTKVGDEPWLISKRVTIPVVVSHDKKEGCSYIIETYEPDIIIIDDGFQSFSIGRELDILLLDATDNFVDSFVLPAGRLREPLSAIKRADIVIITRCNQAGKNQIQRILRRIRRYSRHTPIFLSSHNPLFLIKIPENRTFSPFYLKGKRILSLSSIGNNQSFLLTLKSIGLNIVQKLSYLDHHTYSTRDINRINRLVALHNIDAIITTEKDMYSLRFSVGELQVPLYSLAIELSLEELKRFEMVLEGKGLL